MKSTLRLRWLILLVAGIFGLTFARCVNAAAGEYQKCTTNTDCTVGEFLYDDNYLPIINADCTLTARYPNSNNVFINSSTLPPTADGWYALSVGTSGQALGLYRSQMCCTSGADYLCLDKSFTITQDTAESVWNYNNRTISSLGIGVSEVWSYTDRSLTDFGSLIGDIWDNNTRSLSTNILSGTGGEIATKTTVESVGTSLSFNISNIGSSLASIESKIDSLDSKVNTIGTSLSTIITKWGSYNVSDIVSLINGVDISIGSTADTCVSGDSVYSNIQCIIDKWGSLAATDIYSAASSASTTISNLRSELAYNGKSTTAYQDIQALISHSNNIQASLGNSSDSSSTASIFGRIKQVKEGIDAIDNTSLDLTDLINKWGTLSATDIYDKVKNLSSEITAINTVSNVSTILNTNITNNTTITEVKNQVLSMKALLEVNRIQLEKISNQPIVKTWLEEGSIIFKTLINNPSAITKQTVPLKYYLPSEAKKEDIIKIDGDLKVDYDPTQGALYVSGEFSLDPKETKTVSVEVRDVWQITDEQIASIRKQVGELSRPLEKTSYFAQGSTLKSDIEASLDKIIRLQKDTVTPEAKIKAYREAKIELDAANEKVNDLKMIVTQAGSTGTLFGFIGGVQAISIWGLIIVLVAGFVFLALYMKTITASAAGTKTTTPKTPTTHIIKNTKASSKNKTIILPLVTIISAGITMMGTYSIANKLHPTPPKGTVLSAKTVTLVPVQGTEENTPIPSPTFFIEEPTPTAEVLPTDTPLPLPSPTTVTKTPVGGTTATGIRTMVVTATSDTVNVRLLPSREAKIIAQFSANDEVKVIQSKTNEAGEKWYQVALDEGSGWILAQLIAEKTTTTNATPNVTKNPLATVTVPSHDTVFIYSFPSFASKVIGKLEQTQTVELLTETLRWSKAIFPKLNLEGWVSQDFIQKSN